MGVGLTNSLGQLLFANRIAQQILATRDGLEVTRQGVLDTLNKCGSPSLSLLVQQAAQARAVGTSCPKDTVRAVRRPSGKRPLTLLIRSLNRTPASGTNIPAVLVFMLDPELPVEAAEAGLRQLYGLTASEARMGQLLMSGKTFEDCCSHLAIRPSTARMHLGNLFAKTGVRRQGQLISLLLKSLGVVRATSAGQNINQSLQASDRMELDRCDKRTRETVSAGLEALDLLDMGVGVTDGLGRLLFANQVAQRILATRDGIEVSAQGTLDTLKKCCSPSLKVLLQEIAQDRLRGTSHARGTALAVRRPSGKRPLTLLVRSLDGTAPPSDETGPLTVVFILDPELPVQATEARLRQPYGFTSSEARLARILMEGNTLDDCCARLNIRASTARRHLANMFTKASVRHQGQLICLLLKSVGIVRENGDENLLADVPSRLSSFRHLRPALSPRVEVRTRVVRA
jgi:DNA-binding CsgD family transcriptional regulator